MILNYQGMPYEAPHIWVPSRKIVRVPERERGWAREVPPGLRRRTRFAVPTRVQGSGLRQAGSSNTLVFSFSSLPTAGNYIIMSFSRFSNTTVSVADNQSGNTYAAAVTSPSIGSGDNRSSIWYGKVVGSTGTFTVTITFATGSSGFISGEFSEWSGLAASGVLDQTNSASAGAPASSLASGNITTTLSNELLVAVICSNRLIGTGSWTPPGGSWTQRWTEPSGTTFEAGDGEDQVVSSINTYSATWSFSGHTAALSACIASFKSDIPDSTGRSRGYIIG